MSDNTGVRTDNSTDRRLQNLRPPWKPGETGNVDGARLKFINLAMECRRRTDGGRELVDLHLRIARGETIPLAGRTRGQIPTLDQRLEALRWLSDRGWGRPRELLEISDQSSQAQRLELLRRLSDDERAQLKTILTKALHGTLGPASDAANGREDGDPAIQDDDREIVLPDNGTPVIETEPVNDVIVADDSRADSDLPPPDTAS